jgi:hypothetical protein
MGKAREAVSLKDFWLVEQAVVVTHGPHTFGVLCYPERVSEWRMGLFQFDAQRRGFKTAFVHLLKTLVAAWAVTEGGASVPASEEAIGRLSSGARRAIFEAIVRESEKGRPKGQTEEEKAEVMRMSIELSNLQENLYDTATVPLVFKEGGALVEDVLTVTHRAIDFELWEELTAMEGEESDVPLAARQLARLDARVRDATDKGAPVAEFPAEFWAGLQPALREKIITAVTRNVPRGVLFKALAGEKEGGADVERKDDAQEPAGDSGADAGGGQPNQ